MSEFIVKAATRILPVSNRNGFPSVKALSMETGLNPREAAITVFFLASRGQGDEQASTELGRYQITSCQTASSCCVHVIDTRTGVVKLVEDKDYGKPFDEYKKP